MKLCCRLMYVLKFSLALTAADTPLKPGAPALWRSSSEWQETNDEQRCNADASKNVDRLH
jgi:hypothetical protein